MESVRAFVAVELPPFILERLRQVQEQLQAYSSAVKWVDPTGIHLTLKFLGDVPGDQLEAISQALSRAARRSSHHTVEVEGIGGFPTLISPRVLWVGMKMPEELAELQRLVDEVLAALGFPRENRPFSPHLTLARVREGAGPAERRRLGEAARNLMVGSLGSFPVEEVGLVQSTLTPRGAIYRRLGAFPLG